MTPLFDVVIPNRNKVRFIERTLDALRAQTDSRWRAIVIDNESDDGSWEIIQRVAAQDPRFTIEQRPMPSKQGLPFYRTWNEGLLRARAPYVAVLTSDDLWPANWLARAGEALARHPSAVAFAGRASLIDENDRSLGLAVAAGQFERSFAEPLKTPVRLNGADCAMRALLIGPIFTTIHAVVFRQSALAARLAFAEDLGFAADHEFYLQLCLQGDIVYDPDTSAAFRVYPEQASSAAQNRNVIGYFRTVVERNREAVGRRGAWAAHDLVQRTDELLRRHRFILTKPNATTLKKAPARALREAVVAATTMPLTACRYVAAGLSRERFLGDYAVRAARELSAQALHRAAD